MRIKQTLEKVLDKDAPLLGRIRILFREQEITIASILSALSMTIATIALTITGVFEEGEGSPIKDKGTFKKWLDRLANELKRLAEKATKALPAIIGSVVGAILSFFGKAVGFVSENTWILTVFVARLIGWWLMQNIKKESLVLPNPLFSFLGLAFLTSF